MANSYPAAKVQFDSATPAGQVQFDDSDNGEFSVGTRSAPVSGLTPGYVSSQITPDSEVFSDIGKGLFTNKPVGAVGTIARTVPAALGSTVGGAAGAVSGTLAGGIGAVPGAIGGAALGAGAMEAARNGLVNLSAPFTGGQVSPPSLVMANVGSQALAGAMSEGIGQAATALRPAAVKIGAGLLRIGQNVNTKEGEAVLNNLDLLSSAKTKGEMSDMYNWFEKSNNLQSPVMAQAERGDLIFTHAQEAKMVGDVHGRILAGDPDLTLQELYEASQAARSLKDSARMANQEQTASLSKILSAKRDIDGIIQDATADSGFSYSKLRQQNFESKAAESFSGFYPRNVNGQPNVLRAVAAAHAGLEMGAVAGGAVAGIPGALAGGAAGAGLGLASTSPYVAGLGIRGANALKTVATPAFGALKYAPQLGASYRLDWQTQP